MNRRLIDANALLNSFEVRKVTEYDETGCSIDYQAVPVEAIRNAPTIDAVEVVRCGDCKHSAIDTGTDRLMCARMGEIRPNGHVWGGTAVAEIHFCSYGEKK